MSWNIRQGGISTDREIGRRREWGLTVVQHVVVVS